MAIPSPNFIDVITRYYPERRISCKGDPNILSNIVAEDDIALPDEADLLEKKRSLHQEKVWRAIQVERDARTAGGIKVGENWFHSDLFSRVQQLGLVMFGANLPANINWKTLGGAYAVMTPELAVQIFQALATSDMTVFGVAEWHKAQMMQLEDPGSYDFSGGWPVAYTGSLLN